MKKLASFLAVLGVVAFAAGTAAAETGRSYIPPKGRDIVRDYRGNPVRSTNGECVRTYWRSSCDPCGANEVAQPELTQEERTVYFEFNKSTITKAGKRKLDSLADGIMARGGKVKAVRVAGFADRIGSAAANEKLSKKRADAVRKYLVSRGIVNAQVVETRWFGDSVSSTNCPQSLPRPKLIACLQKDRKVEVEVEYVKEEDMTMAR